MLASPPSDDEALPDAAPAWTPTAVAMRQKIIAAAMLRFLPCSCGTNTSTAEKAATRLRPAHLLRQLPLKPRPRPRPPAATQKECRTLHAAARAARDANSRAAEESARFHEAAVLEAQAEVAAAKKAEAEKKAAAATAPNFFSFVLSTSDEKTSTRQGAKMTVEQTLRGTKALSTIRDAEYNSASIRRVGQRWVRRGEELDA
ncbi:hypothetical protein CDD80_7025 [Ophiocordyceps camponoti-rufipedis]|uniref:Uncharacterized protein n=1 Tax=Ophiocordyceps camponoti-rufipedis TaxID=2004952 RepID=A0A2C5XRL1_9HYPO|nr:hypothetical protein CDD80_7025 [Ophiocordyceps camponoti-rufipedis]